MPRLMKTLVLFAGLGIAGQGLAMAADPIPHLVQNAAPAIKWVPRYAEATRRAVAEKKMLFIYFQPTTPDASSTQFEDVSLRNPVVRQRLANMICLKTPINAWIESDGKKIRLVDHPAFEELGQGPGAVLLDYANADQPYYGHMVSAMPLSYGKYYRFHPSHLPIMLDLPPGTITQRTLVFAVRIHPEAPASTQGSDNPMLMAEAGSHSRYQANIRVQGHHFWEHRFHRITGLLPRGLRAREVCAESWPNERLVDAAVDCVDCWRHSSGHWSAVRANHPHFGYDMQKGSNGIWYATGVFGTNHD